MKEADRAIKIVGGLLIFAHDADSGAEIEFTWQEFEESVRDALDSADDGVFGNVLMTV